ncbi:peptidoglycan-recognition protein SB2-like isoform X1 [Spodoptera litura]|uniref:Peptidoglycan-recognition protein SB2-like isoform X1 n=1 Tax=Spodoptera litura TaxID=69820 RepID=A0A9J7EL20_SPOLT|nr:peptidoglycan-recognition protein SB2-like isoform X1 [Spodoptera litura]
MMEIPLRSLNYHETRHNTNHMEEETPTPVTSEENTPLLHRFPHTGSERNPVTTVIVSLLLVILIGGVIIGIYLLILQNESENILPPIERPLQLVSRSQWDTSDGDQSALRSFPYRLRAVTVVQTGTERCNSTESCTKLLLEMQANVTSVNATLPYNFLISSNGQTYEALGWLKCIPQATKTTVPTGLLLAFIGNFTKSPPTRPQLQEAKNFFDTSVSQQYLHPSYRIFGKNKNDTPTHLIDSLKTFPQWSSEFSDKN